MVTIPLMIVMLALLIAIMIFFLHMMNSTQSIFGIHSFLQYLPIIIYSFIPAIAGYLFDQVVVLLNDLENHSPVFASYAPSHVIPGTRRICFNHEAIYIPIY